MTLVKPWGRNRVREAAALLDRLDAIDATIAALDEPIEDGDVVNLSALAPEGSKKDGSFFGPGVELSSVKIRDVFIRLRDETILSLQNVGVSLND